MKFLLSSGFKHVVILLFCCSLMYFTTSAVANDLWQKSEDFFKRGAYSQAIANWESLPQETKPPIEVLTHIAVAYQTLGNYKKAHAILQQAQQYVETQGTPSQRVLVQSLMGDTLLAQQQPDAAKTHLEEGLVLARTLDEPLTLAHLLNNLGNALYVLQEYAEALTTYTQVVELTERSFDKHLYIQALNNQALVQLKLGNSQSSLANLKSAWFQAQQLPNNFDKGMILLGLGQLALRIQKYLPQVRQTAYQIFTQVLQLPGQNKRLTAYAKGFLGQLYEREQRYQEALQLTNQAIFFAQDFADILYLWEWQRARLLQAQQDLVGAKAAYQQALEHLHPIRTRLFIGQRDTLEVLKERIRPVYFGLADVLLQQAASATPAAKTELLKQAIEKVELIKLIELQEYFQDECVSSVQTSGIELEGRLDKHTAILYPILLQDRTELLLTFADSIHQVIVPVGIDALGTSVHKLRKNLQLSTSPRFISQSTQIYKWLIAPIKDKLNAQDINTLVIVPDGPLRTIPFAALYDAAEKKFLIHHFAIAITPGLNLTDIRPLAKQDITILLNGLSEGVQKFSPLPSVPQEIDKIEALFANNDILLDQTFLLENLSQTLQGKPYEIVHIASHGQFDRNPKKTFLLTYDDKLSMDRLQRLLGFGQLRKKPVELLSLSACQTAVGDERAALGLAGVAIKAGARSAIAILWFVNDEST